MPRKTPLVGWCADCAEEKPLHTTTLCGRCYQHQRAAQIAAGHPPPAWPTRPGCKACGLPVPRRDYTYCTACRPAAQSAAQKERWARATPAEAAPAAPPPPAAVIVPPPLPPKSRPKTQRGLRGVAPGRPAVEVTRHAWAAGMAESAPAPDSIRLLVGDTIWAEAERVVARQARKAVDERG
jgi:hypothetical protein